MGRIQLSRVSKSEGYIPDPGDANQVQVSEGLVPTGRHISQTNGLTYVRNPRGKGGPNRLERYRGGGVQTSNPEHVGKRRVSPRRPLDMAPPPTRRQNQMSGDYDAWGVDTEIRGFKDGQARARRRKRNAGIAGGSAAAGAVAGGGYAASRRNKDVEKRSRSTDEVSNYRSGIGESMLGMAGLGTAAGSASAGLRSGNMRSAIPGMAVGSALGSGGLAMRNSRKRKYPDPTLEQQRQYRMGVTTGGGGMVAGPMGAVPGFVLSRDPRHGLDDR